MNDLLKLSEFARKIGYSRRTVFKLIKEGKLDPAIKRNGINYFTQSQVSNFLEGREDERKTIAYARVSSSNQKKELKTQLKFLEEYAIENDIYVDEYVSEIGSGINFNRKKFLKIIDQILNGEVKKILVTYEDRLVRFAFELINYLAEKNGTEIEIINIKKSSPQEEMVEDLMTVIQIFSSRLYGLRRNSKKIKKLVNPDASKED